MSQQVIKLSDKAANRIKEIISNAEKETLGVRVGVKSGGCAGMEYVLEYAKNINPNDEMIEDKGVKVFIDPSAIIYLLGTEMAVSDASPKFDDVSLFLSVIRPCLTPLLRNWALINP